MIKAVLNLIPLERPPHATVTVPGSKSITNRALLIAALAEGESILDGALFSDDTHHMAESWKRLGVAIVAEESANRFVVQGCGGRIPATQADLFAGNAGTAMRFLVAALCVGNGTYRIDGTPRMRQRPIQDLVDALVQLGADVRCESPGGCPPVVIQAAGLRGGHTTIDASKSSQFLSAVLQVAPYAQAAITVDLKNGLVAAPYIDMTLAVMREFGVEVERSGYEHFRISPQRYRGRAYRIEPDASGAHYFWAAAAITGGCVRVEGLSQASLQGDVRFVDILEQMGATVRRGADFIEVQGPAQLTGVDVDMNAISDTAPTLAAIAPLASGPVHIRNVGHLRLQESDRLHAVATELKRLGATVVEEAEGIQIMPSLLRSADVSTYDDHRIAMSFALLGLRVPGVGICDPDCVRKTFPDFFDRLEVLRR